MNLPNNIKKIRKDNNLSQEQLAEQLGVSRQAISKWESGQSYPEMDKVLMICKLYGCGIDELMHEDIREVRETRQSKANINRYIEDFFDFITRFVGMLGIMTFKEKLKFFFEQVMVAGVLFGIFWLIYIFTNSIFMNGLSLILNYNSLYLFLQYVFQSISIIICTVIAFTIIFHIMKIRYLNYYEMEKPDTAGEAKPEPSAIEEESYESDADTAQEAVSESTDNTIRRRFFLPRPKEKIIIRDPKHSNSGFLMGIMKFVVSVFKAISCAFGLFLCSSFIALTAMLICSFMFVKSGLTFVGVFFALISMLIITFVLLSLIYNFIMSRKNRKALISILLIASLSLAGVGTGLFAVGITDFDVVDSAETTESVYVMEMQESLSIENWYCPTDYVVKDTDKVEITVEHSDYARVNIFSDDNAICLRAYDDGENLFKILRRVISDINSKEICFDYFDLHITRVTVYSNEENIRLIKENSTDEYYKAYPNITATTSMY